MYWDDEEIKKETHERKNRQRRRKGKKSRKRSKAGKIILNLLIFVFACGFVYSAYHLYNIFMVYHHNAQVRSEVRNALYEEIGSEDLSYDALLDASEKKGQSIDIIGKLKKINPEIVGWVHIKDTTIDYPVVKGTDNSFYLNNNVYREPTIAGAIFMDYRNALDNPMQNYILYGHRMRDDSMFGNLVNFKKNNFYNTHKSFTLILENGYYECEIFSVFQTTTYGFKYNKIYPGQTEEEYLAFIEESKNESLYPIDVEVTAADNIVTLSTCDYDLDVNEGRLVVMAKMKKVGDIDPAAAETEQDVPESEGNE